MAVVVVVVFFVLLVGWAVKRGDLRCWKEDRRL